MFLQPASNQRSKLQKKMGVSNIKQVHTGTYTGTYVLRLVHHELWPRLSEYARLLYQTRLILAGESSLCCCYWVQDLKRGIRSSKDLREYYQRTISPWIVEVPHSDVVTAAAAAHTSILLKGGVYIGKGAAAICSGEISWTGAVWMPTNLQKACANRRNFLG